MKIRDSRPVIVVVFIFHTTGSVGREKISTEKRAPLHQLTKNCVHKNYFRQLWPSRFLTIYTDHLWTHSILCVVYNTLHITNTLYTRGKNHVWYWLINHTLYIYMCICIWFDDCFYPPLPTLHIWLWVKLYCYIWENKRPLNPHVLMVKSPIFCPSIWLFSKTGYPKSSKSWMTMT